MKSRMLISMLVIALAAAVIGGATMAWFTDSDASEDVTFTAGTLLIDIDEDNFAAQSKKFDINTDNLNPGDSWEYTFDVKNIGTKNLIFKGMLCYRDIIGQKNEDLDADMRTMLTTKGYGTAPLSDVLEVEFSVVDATWDYFNYGPGVFYKGTLAEYVNAGELSNPPIEFGEASLTPAGGDLQSLSYKVKVTLPEENADNKYQGSKLKAAFVVLAKQIHEDATYPEFECPLKKAD